MKLPRTGKLESHAIATTSIPVSSSNPIESAQHEAERLQQQHPDKRFHLIIDLGKWRTMFGGAQEAEQAALNIAPVSPTVRKKKTNCIIQ